MYRASSAEVALRHQELLREAELRRRAAVDPAPRRLPVLRSINLRRRPS